MNHFGHLLQKICTAQPKASKFQDGGRYPNAISWDFMWVNQDIAMNVSTKFQHVSISSGLLPNCTGLLAYVIRARGAVPHDGAGAHCTTAKSSARELLQTMRCYTDGRFATLHSTAKMYSELRFKMLRYTSSPSICPNFLKVHNSQVHE